MVSSCQWSCWHSEVQGCSVMSLCLQWCQLLLLLSSRARPGSSLPLGLMFLQLMVLQGAAPTEYGRWPWLPSCPPPTLQGSHNRPVPLCWNKESENNHILLVVIFHFLSLFLSILSWGVGWGPNLDSGHYVILIIPPLLQWLRHCNWYLWMNDFLRCFFLPF